MKKLLFLGLLSIAGVAASVTNADAWFFNCCHDWCCNRWSTKLCVRPYNAFSPVAYGNIVADGCMPVNVFGGQLPPNPMAGHYGFGHGYGYPSYGPGCCISGGVDVGSLPAPGAVATVPQTPTQVPVIQGQPIPQSVPGPQFIGPNPQVISPQMINPQVINPGAFRVPMQAPPGYGYGYGYAPVQPIAYYPGYQPMYNPYAANPMAMNYGGQFQAPSYWYGR